MTAILTIAGAELRLSLRNRWIVMAVAFMALLSLALALMGATPGGTVKASPFAVAIVSLASLGVYLLPLLGLLLAYDALIGEIERGTMLLLLTYPLSRTQLLLGKLLGHLCVMTLAIVAGYGVAGLVLGLQAAPQPADLAMAARLVGSSVLLGAIFLVLGYLASILATDRGGAAGIAIGLWLLMVLLYDLGLLGLLAADGEGHLSRRLFPWLLLANPSDTFRMLNLTGFDQVEMVSGIGAAGKSLALGDAGLVGLMLLWVVLPFLLTSGLFRRREL